jgi:hypothetical protein
VIELGMRQDTGLENGREIVIPMLFLFNPLQCPSELGLSGFVVRIQLERPMKVFLGLREVLHLVGGAARSIEGLDLEFSDRSLCVVVCYQGGQSVRNGQLVATEAQIAPARFRSMSFRSLSSCGLATSSASE